MVFWNGKIIMDTLISEQLIQFYDQRGIHPKDFRCQHHNYCRRFAYQGQIIETKMSLVGSLYGVRYPKIVVVSLDPPDQGEKFLLPERRTTEYLAKFTEAENYTVNRPNPHWAMTQIIVKDLLIHLGYTSKSGAAVVKESYSGRIIDNVTPYFAHVNVAKCSMRDPNKRQAAREVHETCSQTYLVQELTILQPDILVTQGKTTNDILGLLLIGKPVMVENLPITYQIDLSGKSVLWMPMRHPTQQLDKIRRDWPIYEVAMKEWAIK